MPNRIIKEGIKKSAQIDDLSWFEEVLYYRLIVTADDYGCVDGRTVLLKNELFPLKENVTKKAVADAVSHLVSVGLLRKYEVNGMPYLLFPTWEKHQRVRNKLRKYPAPPVEEEPVNCPSLDGQLTANCPSESESESNTNTNPISNPKENPNDNMVDTSRVREADADPSVLSVFRSFLEKEYKKLSPADRKQREGSFREYMQLCKDYVAQRAEKGIPLDEGGANSMCGMLEYLYHGNLEEWISPMRIALGGIGYG